MTTGGTFTQSTGTGSGTVSQAGTKNPVPDPMLATPIVGVPTLNPSNTITLGGSVTASVTVSGSVGTPTGTVKFWVSTDSGTTWNTLGSVKTLDGAGSATSDGYTPADAGTGYLIHVDYSGDSKYNIATGNDASLIVNPASLATATVPAPTLNPSSTITIGSSVTASVTVSGSAGTPTGTVSFEYSTDGGTNWNPLGADKTLSSGSATSDSYTPNAVGTNYRIHAVYSGGSNYNGATGSAVSLTVNKADPTVAVPTLSPVSPITLGASVTASVTVSGVSGVTPTGTITFQVSTNGGTSWSTLGATKAFTSGSATLDSYTPASVGSTYQFRAQYAGDTNYNTATGNAASLTVNKANAGVPAPSVSRNPVVVNNAVTLFSGYNRCIWWTNSDWYGYIPSAKIGTGSWANIGSAVTLTSGSASTTYTPATVDSYQFQVIYNGDTNYNQRHYQFSNIFNCTLGNI